VVESNLVPLRDAAPAPNLIFNFKALYENDAAPPNLNTIAYFRSFFPTISIEWIIYKGLLPVLAWREGHIARSGKSIFSGWSGQ
jgi:hypothetical protein